MIVFSVSFLPDTQTEMRRDGLNCKLPTALKTIVVNSFQFISIHLFYSFEYKQERQRFSSLPTVANTFKRRTDPLKGINFTELVNSLGEPEILNLERGKRFL